MGESLEPAYFESEELEELYVEEKLANNNNIKFKTTHRGFGFFEFNDRYGEKCSIQKSSLAIEKAIWFGVNDANPKIMASKTKDGGTGWVEYDVPEDVLMTTRMHLTQDQVKDLLPILQHFAETGELK